jgi:protein-disulfide isomerase
MTAVSALAIGCKGDLEARVKKLEEENAKSADARAFLRQIYKQSKAEQEQRERDEPDPDALFAVDIARNVKAGYADGPAEGAPVTIVACEDFACPYCEQASGTFDELVKEYNGKLRVVFKNLVVHPEAMHAHLAGCAAAKQGKFQEFKREYWEKGFKARKMDEANIAEIAKGVGLDMAKYKTDVASDECKQLIDGDRSDLEKFKVSVTPSLFINGTFIVGALPKEEFKKMIDARLATAQGNDHYDKVVMATGEKQFRSKMDSKKK